MAEASAGSSSTIFSTNFGGKVLKNLAKQQETGKHCDITVIAEGRRFHAHRCVLAAASKYFSSLLDFQQDRPHQDTTTAQLSDVSAAGFETALEFIYTSGVNTEKCSWEELLQAARFLEIQPLEEILMSDLQLPDSDNTTTTHSNNEITTPSKKQAKSPQSVTHTEGGKVCNGHSTPPVSPSQASRQDEETEQSQSASTCRVTSTRRVRRARKNPRPHKVRSSSDKEENERKINKDIATSLDDVFTDASSSEVTNMARDDKNSVKNGTATGNIVIENTFSLHGLEDSIIHGLENSIVKFMVNSKSTAPVNNTVPKPPPKYSEVVPPNVTVGQHIPNGHITRIQSTTVSNNTSISPTYSPHNRVDNNLNHQVTVKTEKLDNSATNTPQVSPVINASNAVGPTLPTTVPYLQSTGLPTSDNISIPPGLVQGIPQVTSQLPSGAIIHLLPNPLGLGPVTPLLQQYPFQLLTTNSNVLLQVSCPDQLPPPEVSSPTGSANSTDGNRTPQTSPQDVLQALRVDQPPSQEQVGPHLNVPTLVKLVLVSQADFLSTKDIVAHMNNIKPSILTEYPESVLDMKVKSALDTGLREGVFTRKRDVDLTYLWAINTAKLKTVVEELRWNVYRHTIYKNAAISS